MAMPDGSGYDHKEFEKLMVGEGPCQRDKDCQDSFTCLSNACIFGRVQYGDYFYEDPSPMQCCGIQDVNYKAIKFIPTTFEQCM